MGGAAEENNVFFELFVFVFFPLKNGKSKKKKVLVEKLRDQDLGRPSSGAVWISNLWNARWGGADLR